MPNDKLAFEPFGSLDNVLSGGPIKIMPLGTFYRDNRKLEITEADLREIEKNTADGLPRFRIPINENHQGVGKVGTVKAVKFMDAGIDGPGLYATDYELTDEGKKLVQAKRFDAVSPEVIWTKNGGAKYQDPNTGKQVNNVIVGLALTDRPFFGHDNVALFSADNMAADVALAHKKLMDAAKLHQGHIDGTEPTSDASQKKLMNLIDSAMKALGMGSDNMAETMPMMPTMMPPPKRNNGYTKLKELMRQKFDELMAMVTDRDGDGEPDEMPEPMASTLIEVSSALPALAVEAVQDQNSDPTAPAPAPADIVQGKDNMADVTQPTAPAAPEKFNISAEEFAALKAKADKVEAIEAAAAKQAETFAAQLKATEARAIAIERAAKLSQMQARCEEFSAMPVQAEELAEKFMDLEEKDPDLFKYFDGLLTALDTQVAQAGLFSQVTSARTTGNIETFEAQIEKTLKDKFGGDRAKYADAMNAAALERPDLYAKYSSTYNVRGKGE